MRPFPLIFVILVSATLQHALSLSLPAQLEQSAAGGQEKAKRSQFVSDASFIVATHRPKTSDHSPEGMAKAANRFLETLDRELQSKARHKLNSPERRLWTNLPARADAGGVRFGELNEKQIRAACDLMATLFSEQGYQRIIHIMIADDQLLRGGQPRQGFGTENFSIVVFGRPSPEDPWAFQLDGHHVGANVAISGKKLTISPSFIGTQPEAFQISQKVRPLGTETDDAYKFVGSLSDAQKKRAIVGSRRGQLRTGPGKDGLVPKPLGIPGSELNAEQQKRLIQLISHWVHDMPKQHAEREMKKIEKEIGKTFFAWRGPEKFGGDVSFAIQGPTVIIEYACQQLGGNPRDHLHSMYRDPTNEYGKQLDEKK